MLGPVNSSTPRPRGPDNPLDPSTADGSDRDFAVRISRLDDHPVQPASMNSSSRTPSNRSHYSENTQKRAIRNKKAQDHDKANRSKYVYNRDFSRCRVGREINAIMDGRHVRTSLGHNYGQGPAKTTRSVLGPIPKPRSQTSMEAFRKLNNYSVYESKVEKFRQKNNDKLLKSISDCDKNKLPNNVNDSLVEMFRLLEIQNQETTSFRKEVVPVIKPPPSKMVAKRRMSRASFKGTAKLVMLTNSFSSGSRATRRRSTIKPLPKIPNIGARRASVLPNTGL